MLYCPKCRKESEDSFEFCKNCGTKLTISLPNEPEEINDKEAFLINAEDEMEANIFISKLSAFGIPVMKKYVELGLPVFMGNSRLGIDLYVPSRLLLNAKDILKEEILTDDEIEFDNLLNDYGFEDIDNLDFEDDENEKVINKQHEPDMADTMKEELEKVKAENFDKNRSDKHCNILSNITKNKKNPTRVFAVIVLIILGIYLIHTVFKTLGILIYILK